MRDPQSAQQYAGSLGRWNRNAQNGRPWESHGNDFALMEVWYFPKVCWSDTSWHLSVRWHLRSPSSISLFDAVCAGRYCLLVDKTLKARETEFPLRSFLRIYIFFKLCRFFTSTNIYIAQFMKDNIWKNVIGKILWPQMSIITKDLNFSV